VWTKIEAHAAHAADVFSLPTLKGRRMDLRKVRHMDAKLVLECLPDPIFPRVTTERCGIGGRWVHGASVRIRSKALAHSDDADAWVSRRSPVCETVRITMQPARMSAAAARTHFRAR
jgi:hypothetical protein